MGIEQIRMNQTKALPPVPQFNWSQMESRCAEYSDSLGADKKIGKLGESKPAPLKTTRVRHPNFVSAFQGCATRPPPRLSTSTGIIEVISSPRLPRQQIPDY